MVAVYLSRRQQKLWIVVTDAPGTAHKPHVTASESDLRAPHAKTKHHKRTKLA
jgi:hypothetical protein